MAEWKNSRQRSLFATLDESIAHSVANVVVRKRVSKHRKRAMQRAGIWEWHQTTLRCMSALKGELKQSQRTAWEIKCDTAVVSLRNRTHRGSGKDVRICMTWNQRCKAAKVNLKAAIKRPLQDAWKKKCSSCALNHKRKHKG